MARSDSRVHLLAGLCFEDLKMMISEFEQNNMAIHHSPQIYNQFCFITSKQVGAILLAPGEEIKINQSVAS